MCVEITHEFGAVLFLTFHPVWFYSASVIASQQLRERLVLQLWHELDSLVCFQQIYNLPHVAGEFVTHQLTEQLQLVLWLCLKLHRVVIQKYRFFSALAEVKGYQVSKISQAALCSELIFSLKVKKNKTASKISEVCWFCLKLLSKELTNVTDFFLDYLLIRIFKTLSCLYDKPWDG